MILRYEQYLKENISFDDQFKKMIEWIDESEDFLRMCSEIVGDMKVLSEKRAKLSDLNEGRSEASIKVDNIIELGERLYSHTAPEGREAIRQQLRMLRDRWEIYSDDVEVSLQKMDACLEQFAEFTTSQEELTRWLRDIEQVMQQQTDLKGTLQEKKAQLQNHRLVHSEITTHQNLVEAVCSRSKKLVEQTQDKSLHVYISSIKQLFVDIGKKSKDLMVKLENCISEHSQLLLLTNEFQNWILLQRGKYQPCQSPTGERAELHRKMSVIKELKSNKQLGDSQLIMIKNLTKRVCHSTSSKGGTVLRKCAQELEETWKNHLICLNASEEQILNALSLWTKFESGMELLGSWFKDNEAVFRQMDLLSTLDEKEKQLSSFKKKREIIIQYEKEVDNFVDQANILLAVSGVERIKPFIIQLSNRYQSLHILSKEWISKWECVVTDHAIYEEKFLDLLTWIVSTEEIVESVIKGKLLLTLSLFKCIFSNNKDK